ncbi:biotin/lipoyl-binding carrier protein [Carboxydochorda subterranea]|uniref:Biotin/lipoyl-binding carrier protein n=1 Tax=Carboxydichorda subterranea TaxID=3109565 RepID=A0ABZ1BWG5_9FIRM|nr:biotin/lipoyl-binding carrier protein [Limnochorda sp. L945t]WRP16805.1 biotin/lipoyl-binding carrier protein [Limnochorda sp. L945t]
MTPVKAEMTGMVARVAVEPGASVRPGDEVVVLESMKMEIPVTAPAGGQVREVRVRPGDFVQEGDVLVVLE